MSRTKNVNTGSLLSYFGFIQLITVVSIYFDLIILRQLFSFISLTFIPGYLILRRIDIKFSDFFEMLLLSTGLSIFYLMILGLAINLTLPIFNIVPLTEFNILFTFIIFNFILIIINIGKKGKATNESYELVNFIKRNKGVSLITLIFLILNIMLNILAYFYSYKLIYVSIIFNIVLLYFFIIYKYNEKYKNLYYLIILIISSSLILQNILSSEYLIGADISIEYFVFKITKNNNYWDPYYFDPTVWTGIITYNSMLSVTILPTIYSYFFNIRDDLIFKIIYPFIFSLVPLILIKIYNSYIKDYTHYSFIAIMFFLSDETIFYGVIPLSLCKQIMAVFYMLLFFLMLNNNQIKIIYKQILLIIFGFSIVISHYSTSYIFLFLVVLIYVTKKFMLQDDINLSTNLVLILISTKIIWDAFITIKTVNYLYSIVNSVYNRFIYDLMNPSARNRELIYLTGGTGSIINLIHRIIVYIVHIFLSIGVMSIFINRETGKIKNTYKIISSLCFFIIITVVFVPVISSWFGITRFRSMAMLFLTPFIVIGYDLFLYLLLNIQDIKLLFNFKNIRLENYIKFNASSKSKYLHLLTLLLVSYFLFNIGFMNYAFNDKPISYFFDSDRMALSDDSELVASYFTQLNHIWDVYSASWLKNMGNPEINIYSDYVSAWDVLISYGLMDNVRVDQIRNNTILYEGNYIFMSYMNLDKNITASFMASKPNSRALYNTSYLYPVLDVNNKIYSNGYSNIYQCTSNDQNIVVFEEGLN